MAAKKAKTLRDRKQGRPRKEADRRVDASTEGRKRRRDEQRIQEKAAALQSGAVVAPPDHPREVQPHGGALLRAGVPGNRGGYIAAMRRRARKRLLIALQKGGGLDFLEDVIAGKVGVPVLNNGVPVLGKDDLPLTVVDAEFRKKAIDTALKFGLGEISSHALVNENDEAIESGVVQLPMLDAAPVPPLVDESAAVESVRATVRKAALDAAAALIQAAK